MSDIPAYDSTRVAIDGHEVVTYSIGSGDNVLFLLNGGPGLPCDYLREPHAALAEKGFRVVTYDQLGCGQSAKPNDKSLWRIERYVEEVETVRKALGLGKIHLLGHSWGGWLGIDYALKYTANLRSFVLSSTCADMPHLISELNRLRAALGPETVAMMQRHEAAGTIGHPAYQAAITILNYRHVCRLDHYPASLKRSLDNWNMDVYGAMQGPNEFCYTGNLRDWNCTADLHHITVPCLILQGGHDEITAACALKMQLGLPKARTAIFQNSSHTPLYEEPEHYNQVLLEFLAGV